MPQTSVTVEYDPDRALCTLGSPTQNTSQGKKVLMAASGVVLLSLIGVSVTGTPSPLHRHVDLKHTSTTVIQIPKVVGPGITPSGQPTQRLPAMERDEDLEFQTAAPAPVVEELSRQLPQKDIEDSERQDIEGEGQPIGAVAEAVGGLLAAVTIAAAAVLMAMGRMAKTMRRQMDQVALLSTGDVQTPSAKSLALLSTSGMIPEAQPPSPKPEGVAPGDLYFDVCADCMRSWDKAADGPTDEPWRGSGYEKLDCGEDSFVLGPSVVGVADGVGGWREVGVDPGEFANSICRFVKQQVDAKTTVDPVQLMSEAYFQTLARVEYGSSTCTLATLAPDGTLSTANMGDSGLVVIRGDQAVHETSEMQFGFNAPFQLTTQPKAEYMMPQNAWTTEFQLQAGDFVIVATDGLLDNLYIEQIIKVCCTMKDRCTKDIAKVLKAEALAVTKDRRCRSPFAAKAEEAGYYYAGGKPDDITVVVARVAQA